MILGCYNIIKIQIKIPLLLFYFVYLNKFQSEANSLSEWNDHFCFIGMGDHYIGYNYQASQVKYLPVWLLNRLISAGLEPILSHTEKLCIALYYIQFFTNIKITTIRLKPVIIAHAFSM